MTRSSLLKFMVAVGWGMTRTVPLILLMGLLTYLGSDPKRFALVLIALVALLGVGLFLAVNWLVGTLVMEQRQRRREREGGN